MGKIDFANPNYLNGLLSPTTASGKGTIIEYVVIATMGDCIKESFNYAYDLTSRRLGEINVKSSERHNTRNGYMWSFGKKPNSYIPNYYVCVGLDDDSKEIIHVWEIPGDERAIGSHGIHITDTLRGLKRVEKYEVDPAPYNDAYKKMDITAFPEFENINNDAIVQTRSIADDIFNGVPEADLINAYGDDYYQRFLNWVDGNGFNKYFNLHDGKIGIFPGEYFAEMTDERFPVFDYEGKYIGYNDNDKLRVHRWDKYTTGSPVSIVKKTIQTFTKTQDGISLEDLKLKSGLDDIDKIISHLSKDGYIYKSKNNKYKVSCFS